MTVDILLTILCICSFLQLIAVIAILIVALLNLNKTVRSMTAVQEPKAPKLSPMEEEILKEQKKRFDEEAEAFQQILNYNADVAYGIHKGDK